MSEPTSRRRAAIVIWSIVGCCVLVLGGVALAATHNGVFGAGATPSASPVHSATAQTSPSVTPSSSAPTVSVACGLPGGPQPTGTPAPEGTEPVDISVALNGSLCDITGMSKDSLSMLTSTLVGIAKRNGCNDVSSAVIRSDSTKNTYDASSKINTTQFIADVPSCKQSYSGTFVWSSDPAGQAAIANVDTPALMDCLPDSSELIYGAFACQQLGI